MLLFALEGNITPMDHTEPIVKRHSNEGPLDTGLNNFANFLRKPGIRLSGAAAAAALTFTLVGCGVSAQAEPPAPSASNSSEAPTPTATETETPVGDIPNNMGDYVNDSVVTPENAEQRLAELQFTADMDPETLGRRYNDILNRWTMAGATPETWEKWYNDSSGLTIEEIAHETAEANAATYATALYGENYANIINPNQLDARIANNADNIMRFINTFGNDEFPNTVAENEEAWHTHTDVVGVEVVQTSDTEAAIILTQELQSNSDKTMLADEAEASGWNGYRSSVALKFVPAPNDSNIRIVISQHTMESQ